MAHIQANILPKSLGYRTNIEIIIPQDKEKTAPAEKILYLLHGLGQDCSAWGRYSRIEEYAEVHNYAIIMPSVQRSFYMDMSYGSDYFTYVSEELPQIVEQLFNLKHIREKTFVAGLSMGGYGALKCALSRPDFYAAGASFSGAVDPPAQASMTELFGMTKQSIGIYGTDLVFPDHVNLSRLAEKAAELPIHAQPRLMATCGDKDFLLLDNRKFSKHMRKLGLPFTYTEWEGDHNWTFWEASLPLAFKFFENTEANEN